MQNFCFLACLEVAEKFVVGSALVKLNNRASSASCCCSWHLAEPGNMYFILEPPCKMYLQILNGLQILSKLVYNYLLYYRGLQGETPGVTDLRKNKTAFICK